MSSDTLRKSYDDVPYPELPYSQTHPDRLATLAIILGLTPAPVTNCRVLELGCARGANIIPMAYGLPNSSFVGIDFSAKQIKSGQIAINSLGLQNIKLVQADILSLTDDIGEYDYIIAHGVYSWTPEAVREKLMVICKRNLAANGVAFVSYNAYPGWYMWRAIRSMLNYHTRQIKQPRARVEKARELISFLVKGINVNDPYGIFLNEYRNMINIYEQFDIRKRRETDEGDNLVLHDELAEVNDAFYFHDFITHAAQHGLQYLTEAEFPRAVFGNLNPETEQTLLNISSDLIALEQYIDFLRNSSFRQTLLCHEDLSIERLLKPDSSWLSTLYAASYANPVKDKINVRDNSTIEFRIKDGVVSTTDHPVSKAALLYLSSISPQSVSLTSLLEIALQSVYGKKRTSLDNAIIEHDTQALMESLLKSFSCDMRLVELRVHEPRFVVTAGERPLASKLARWQVQHGHIRVTNMRHEMVDLLQLSIILLPHLDGKNDREALLTILLKLVKQGDIELRRDDKKIVEVEGVEARKIMEQELEKNLQWLGRVALLEA
jgi:methyltransferase-like protein/predicted O-methyltransferase YrrM